MNVADGTSLTQQSESSMKTSDFFLWYDLVSKLADQSFSNIYIFGRVGPNTHNQ